MFYHFPKSGHYASLPISLELLGFSHHQEPIQRPHGFPLFQWFYGTKGHGEFLISGQRSILFPGQGLFIEPGIAHSYRGLTSDFTVHFIGFQGNACAEILQSLCMQETGIYHISDPEIFPSHINQILTLVQQTNFGKEAALSKACYSMLLDLSFYIHRIQNSAPASENELVQKMIDFLEQSYASPVTLTDLADHVNLSKEYTCTLFKHTMQQTIIQYLQTVRISRARIFLIQYPERRVSEIAHLCGFESPSYFGSVFKKICGCTPEEFRRFCM